MAGNTRISGRLITAARGLPGISPADFANAAGLSLDTLDLIERGGSALIDSKAHAAALTRGLQHFGIVIIEEENGFGAGVSLKFTRQDVRQIVRLEGEGGQVGSDDAP